MSSLANKILEYDWINRILDHEYVGYLYGMTSTQIWILILLVATLVLFAFYHWVGPLAFWGMFVGLTVVFFVYSFNIYGFYQSQEEKNEAHYEEVQKNMIKSKRLK